MVVAVAIVLAPSEYSTTITGKATGDLSSIQPKCRWGVKRIWASSVWTNEAVITFRMEQISAGPPLPPVQPTVIFSEFGRGIVVAKRHPAFQIAAGVTTMYWTNPTTNFLTRVTRGLTYLAGAAALVLSSVLTVPAQQSELTPPKVETKLVLGGASFAEPSIPHSIVGGAVRVYLTRRFSVEPEFLYMRHDRHDEDYFVQVNAAYDITDPRKRFVAYGIVGAGNFRNRSDFGRDGIDTSFKTWTASVGGGVKIFATKRLFIAPEVRVGREPDVRGTVSVGYVLVGRK